MQRSRMHAAGAHKDGVYTLGREPYVEQAANQAEGQCGFERTTVPLRVACTGDAPGFSVSVAIQETSWL